MKPLLKKNIIVTVEVGPRETIPATYLCAQLAKSGFRVFLTTNRAAKILEHRIENCIFLHKSTIEKYAIRYKKTMGATVCFLDAEMGIPIPDKLLEVVCHDRFIEVNSEKYDTVFALGEKYKTVMQKMPEFSGVKVVASGWPRFDVLLHRDGDFFKKEAEKIKQKYGKFILIVSSFGFVTANEFKLSMSADKEFFGDEYQNPAWHYFNEFVEMTKKIASSYDGKVVFRPHPSESLNSWRKLIGNHNNIHIEGGGDINIYISACDRLVQFRSSSTLEAAFLGVENLSLKIDGKKFDTDGPLYRLRNEFDSVEGLLSYIEKKPPSKAEVKENAFKEVRNYISNLDGNASAIIVDELLTKPLLPVLEPNIRYLIIVLHNFKMKLFDLFEKVFFSTIFSPTKWKNLVSYKDKLESPLERSSVVHCIDGFSDLSGFEIKNISRDLVQIDFEKNNTEYNGSHD